MEYSALLMSLPAVIALLFKGGIFLYARSSRTHNLQTRLYLLFVFALSLQNVMEISHFHALTVPGAIPYLEAIVFYAMGIIAIALLLHLAASVAYNDSATLSRLIKAVYAYALALEALLLFTPWLISDFVRFEYSVSRVAGPLFFFFEYYAVGAFLAIIGLLYVGMKYQTTSHKRTKSGVLLLAVVPLAVVVISVLALLHLGVRWVNGSMTIALAMTYFLAVTAYAIHQHRLFDIEFFIPGSKVRRRKTAFYRRIQAVIAEIADLDSVEQAVRRLGDTLGCGVTLIGGNRPVLAQAGASPAMAQIPRSILTRFDHIVVANEIADTLPEVHQAMRAHGVAAIVPFHPHSQQAAGWLVLGDAFSEQVYTARDFRLVEQLFDKMADLFLDKLITMRTQLTDAMKQIRLLERRHEELRVNVELLQEQNASLNGQNELLRKQQPVDSLGVAAPPIEIAPRVCILGRDKALVKALRRSFPQAGHYVSAASAGFKRLDAPDLLIAHLGEDAAADAEPLAAWLDAQPSAALLLCGKGAAGFATGRDFGARLVEILPTAGEELLCRRAQALAELRQSTQALTHPEQPLVGRSEAFTRLLSGLRALAGLTDPLVLQTDDTEQGLALTAFIHAAAGAQGRYVAWRDREPQTPDDVVVAAAGGTLAVDWSALRDEARTDLITAVRRRRDVRVLVVAPADAAIDFAPARPFVVAVPTLRERRADLPLLVHYFTLAFNLKTGNQRYLQQAQIDEMLLEGYPQTMSELRRRVHEALLTRLPAAEVDMPAPARLEEKTLDQHIAEYEARIIEETLRRCGGNKSQAARLLGLRPNTLHYKLARYARTVIKDD